MLLWRCLAPLVLLAAAATAGTGHFGGDQESTCQDSEAESHGALLQIKQEPGQKPGATQPYAPDSKVSVTENSTHVGPLWSPAAVRRLPPWCWQSLALVLFLLLAATLARGVLTRSEEASGGTSARSAETLISLLGNLWPQVVLAGAAAGVLVPLIPYISQNFFARMYTDLPSSEIHCESHPDSEFCVAAVNDSVRWKSRMGFIVSALTVVLSPSLGLLSDAYGRKPVLVACQAIKMLPDVALGLHIYLDVSLYLWYALQVLEGVNVLGCFFALVTDLVKQQECRAGAFGLVLIAYETAMLTGMAIGLLLPMRVGLAVGLLLHCMNMAYVVLGLRETLPSECLKPLALKPLAPLLSLGILFRSGSLRLLTAVFMISGFVDHGIETIGVGFFQKYLTWDSSANYISAMLGQFSILVWIGILLEPVSQRCGEVGLLIVSQLAGALYSISLCYVSNAQQVFAATSLLCGATSLSFPATAALKGAMVEDGEQGHIQGAVQAIKHGSEALGQLAFGLLFNRYDSAPQRTAMSGVPFLIGTVLNVLSLPITFQLSQSSPGQPCTGAKANST
eukprot:TRINITY_DN48040_c0_g1_i1.p1 TRINITY_DN48040_c0_g1~~TRINITY_DN48040_c0_g1_i1.p1  ORF type:complete len:573 (+),score=89.02 TRINITY_DN48040_c0_g1_i1:26-1720(+)